MSVRLDCPACGAEIRAARQVAGRQLRCPSCDQPVQVPVVELQAVSAHGSGGAPSGADVALVDEQDVFDANDDLEGIVTPPARAPLAPPPLAPPPVGTPPAPDETSQDEGPEEFGDSLRRKRPLEDTEMDMTPMCDVTFLLLIFFMVTASFAVQKSLQIPRPEDDEAASTNVQQQEQDESSQVTVRVDEFGSYHVVTNDFEEEAPSPIDLLRYLRLAREGDSVGKVPTVLMVEAHRKALHKRVVVALDSGSDTGFETILLTSTDGDE